MSVLRKVTFERTACYGRCPVYRLTVHGTGEVEWIGERFVAREGTHRWTISPDKVERLWDAFAKADFLALNDGYTFVSVTDAPGCVTSIELEDGRFKKVDHYHGDDTAPETLYRLENLIDAIVGTGPCIKGGKLGGGKTS